jgi:hypothetical protein
MSSAPHASAKGPGAGTADPKKDGAAADPASDPAKRTASSRPPPADAGTGARLSKMPPSESAERLAARLLDSEDLEFVKALRGAGLLGELEGEELLRVATSVSDATGLERRIDMLEDYYGAAGDTERSYFRRRRDRFFMQRASEASTAKRLVIKLAELAPEVGAIGLERIGGSTDGPLVLRAGEHFAALLDDYEENLDTDEVDLREIEDARHGHVTMVTLRGLVRAVNVLLDRNGVRERMVALRSDEDREVYVATSVTEAIELARGGWLEDEDVEQVMELGGW